MAFTLGPSRLLVPTPALEIVANAMTEDALQSGIIRLARAIGGLAYHTRYSIQSVAGFPDLVIALPDQGRVIFAELKRQRGKPTAKQQEWLAALAATGSEVYLWRPLDWHTNRIERVLAGVIDPSPTPLDAAA